MGFKKARMGNLLPNLENSQSPAPLYAASTVFLESGNPIMRQVEAIAERLAQNEVPLLILGERGAGKRHLAQRIHAGSLRGTRPLSEIACFGLRPEDLMAAHKASEAVGGTVFLKEFQELNSSCQHYLCDALAKGSANGQSNGIFSRFICGSTVDLEVEVKARKLREDLYYRMSGVSLRLPPLRQRAEDIPVFTEYFLEKHAREYARPVPKLSSETRRLFQEYSWPGNLRELEDAARVIVALGNEHHAMGGLRALLQQKRAEAERGAVSLKAASRAASHEAEKELILDVLTRTRWNRRQAAKQLQISYKALLYKLKQIGCEEQGFSDGRNHA
jgi:two-component system, NtrC family, response regulator AtoC